MRDTGGWRGRWKRQQQISSYCSACTVVCSDDNICTNIKNVSGQTEKETCTCWEATDRKQRTRTPRLLTPTIIMWSHFVLVILRSD